MTMKTTLDDEADPPMVVVFTPLEGNASASHMIDKSRHLSDGNSLAPVSTGSTRLEKGAKVVAAAEAAMAAAETRLAPLMDPTLHVTDDGDLSEKIGELEDRAKRLSREEREELKRGRELNIITDPAPGK